MNEYNKLIFYIRYLYYLLRIPLDVKKGRINIIVAESIWICNRLFKLNLNIPARFAASYYETIYGKFYITPDLLSTIAVSPVFEREDVEYLFKNMSKSLNDGKNVLFIDIGAFFGDYTVKVGNHFRRSKNLDIIAFEPDTDYLSEPTFKLFKKNIKTNKLNKVKLYKLGISNNRNTNNKYKTLDEIIPNSFYKNYDIVFIKLDIDDFVMDGLFGIETSVNKFKNTFLLVEDFVKPKETFRYLNKNNYKFITKISPYNSFWKFK